MTDATSSGLPISSPYRSTPQAPVTEVERNQLSRRLNEAFSSGELDAEDYRQRLDRLFAAQRMAELVPVVDGLPALSTYTEPAIVSEATGAPGELAAARTGSRFTLLIAALLIAVVLVVAILLLALL